MTWLLRSASLAVCTAFLSTLPASTQAPANPPLRFEVSSVKPSRPDNPNSNFNLNEGRFSAEKVDLSFLLKEAFGLNTGSNDQILDAPAWIHTTHFDIQTRIDDTTAAVIKAMPPEQQEKTIDGMVQTLLKERFNLKVRTEYQPRTVDALVLAKNGSKLQPFTGCDVLIAHTCQPTGWQGLHNDGAGHTQGQGASIGMLINVLASQPDVGGRMVVDNTGLTGKYNFDLHYTPENAAGVNAGPTLFTALEEQLGLKLETKKLPIKVLVIEHLDHPSPD